MKDNIVKKKKRSCQNVQKLMLLIMFKKLVNMQRLLSPPEKHN